MKGKKSAAKKDVKLRVRLWVEVGAAKGMTEAGADLLEQILICGSLSEAARRLGFSYRRAWMTMNAMNKAWGAAVVSTATGGVRGGGAKVTELGQRVLAGFRALQVELEHFVDYNGAGFCRGAGL